MAPPVARKTDEGFGRPNADEELPLDINYGKLIEWLVSRKKLVADWRKRLAVIQAQAAALAKDLPAELRSDATLDYLRCRQVAAELAKTAERSMFGGLTGPAKEWEKVVRVYEKGNVFLGEAALALASNTDYEIPFLRKQTASFNSQVVDHERRAEELKSSAKAAAVAYRTSCEELSIEGKSVRSELAALVITIPSLFQESIALARDGPVGDAMDYYAEFASYSSGTASCAQEMLQTLSEVRDGTTSAPSGDIAEGAVAAISMDAPAALEVQWDLFGAADDAGASEAPTLSWDIGGTDGAEEAPITLNWDIGAADAADADPPSLQWDVEVPAEEAAAAVNWDIDVSAGAEAEAAAGGIDWGIGMVDGGDDPSAGGIDWGIEASAAEAVEITMASGDTPAANDSLLSDPVTARLTKDTEYRNMLLDDLTELQSFLTARTSEVRGTSAAMLLANAPESIQRVGVDACASMLAAVEGALTSLMRGRLRQLLRIQTSPQYTTGLVRTLEMKAAAEGKLLSGLREVEAKREEAQRQLVLSSPKIQAAVDATRELKKAVETKMTAMLKRRVNIIGEINTVLNK